MQNQLVFGAGLIGCYLGTVLAKVSQLKDPVTPKVTLYCRPSVAERIHDGVTLSDYNQNKVLCDTLNLVDNLTALHSCNGYDLIWLTVKCTSVEQAVVELAPIVEENTVLLCCQNGLDSDSIVRQAFPNNRVVRVMVPFNVVEQPGPNFHRGSEGKMVIEHSEFDQQILACLRADAVNKTDEGSILPLDFCRDMTAMQWAKLQLNLGNSVNALANIPVKAMLEQRKYRLVIAAMMSELLNVTQHQQYQLPKIGSVTAGVIPWVLRLPDFLFKRVANQMLKIDPNVRTSMWWDLQQGRVTEIEYLNGAVVRYAQQAGLPCGVNQAVVNMIHAREQKKDTEAAITAEDLYTAVGLG